MVTREESGRLGAELRRSALRQVEVAYRDSNHSLFGGRLRAPVLEWSDAESELGAWVREARSLRLSESLLLGPWGELLEVLKHEMAHQYVDEVLGVHGEGPHGPTFQKICRERGIDPRAAGRPRSGDVEEGERTAVLRRIASLLALAQSDNQHEAELAMATARRLMLKYNLEQATENPSAYSFRHVGTPTGRRAAWQRVLATILSDHFFVDVLIVPVYRPLEGKRGSVLEIMGRLENLEMAAYVHDFLECSAADLWQSHKKREGLASDKDRLSYLFGVMSGFRDKLEAEERRSQKEGLVWLGDPELSRYARARHPYVRRVGSSGRVARDAFSAGREAGRSLVLSRGVGAGVSAGGPRLLGGAKR